jgi:malic enzyme
MERYVSKRRGDGKLALEAASRGASLLRHPLFNKGSAFTHAERKAFRLTGLLPAAVSSMEQQARRVYANIVRKEDPLERYIGLAALQDRNEHLFYRVLVDHLEEFLPIVYTPTVGRACKDFSRIFRRARGLWITPGQRGEIAEVLESAPFDDVRLVVVTDNERILGLGDQGAGGIGIPIGKLALYSAAAGIPPWQTLPVSLDVGTDNRALLDDDLYLGWRHERLRGEPYDSLVEEFVRAVHARFPRAILQWEDFKKENALRLLGHYRKTLPSFNDDIQGTAGVALAGILASTRVTGTAFGDQRIVIMGAGAAGIGIARLLRDALQRAGLGRGEALKRIAVLDSRGLLVDDVGLRDASKREFAWPVELAASLGLPMGARDLESVVRAVRPSVLIGTSGAPQSFTPAALHALAAHVERPVVLLLSNPSSRSEGRPGDMLAWSDGRALVATASSSESLHVGDRTLRIGQASNAFVFPAIGLGALVAEAREVTDGMFVAAATSLAAEVAEEDLAAGSLFPRIRELRRITARMAQAVVREARDAGVGKQITDAAIPGAVAEAIWDPCYPPLTPAGSREGRQSGGVEEASLVGTGFE